MYYLSSLLPYLSVHCNLSTSPITPHKVPLQMSPKTSLSINPKEISLVLVLSEISSSRWHHPSTLLETRPLLLCIAPLLPGLSCTCLVAHLQSPMMAPAGNVLLFSCPMSGGVGQRWGLQEVLNFQLPPSLHQQSLDPWLLSWVQASTWSSRTLMSSCLQDAPPIMFHGHLHRHMSSAKLIIFQSSLLVQSFPCPEMLPISSCHSCQMPGCHLWCLLFMRPNIQSVLMY